MNFLPLILLCLSIMISLVLAIGMNVSKRRFRKKIYPVIQVWSAGQGLLLAIGLPISIHSGGLVWLNLLGLIVWSLSPARSRSVRCVESATVQLLNLVRQRGLRAWVLSGIFFLTLLTSLQINLWFSSPAMAATENFALGAYIIDMGQATQTVANGLKPYGLVYELAVNRGIPVKWAIEPTKAKGGSDFIAAGKTYKGSAFIIPAAFAADAATAVTTWRATGVVVDGPLATGFSAPIYDTITSFPRIALDQANGSIAQSYLTNAGIPAIGTGPYGNYNTYRFATPAQLTDCDDLYAMPHADPTWATHSNLIPFNAGKGYIWAACHAVNVLENIDDPGDVDTAPDMNFLSTNGLVPHKSHANGVSPYTYKSIADADPVMQFIGSLDGATENGSEQVYLPNLTSSWRPTTRIAVIDPDHPQVPPASSVLSPGEAVKVAYGRGFGLTSNGMVMYEGGHNHTGSGTVAEQVAAQRAFLNFALLAGIERGLDVSSTIPTNVVSGSINNVSAIATGGSGVYTYKWYSSCGGTFANSNSASTTFTAPTTGASCSVRVVVSDSCNRRSINAASVLFPARMISGTVFEDVNYGGGLGRSQVTATGIVRPNATVELYDSLNSYVRKTVTDVNGKYTFMNLPDNSTYQIRVVNSTVTSSRNSTAVGLLPVQTFRTDAGTTTATGTTVSGLFDRVGGEKPSEVDPAANNGLQTLSDLNNLTNQEVQSLTLVNIVTTDVAGVDFGYNFDTIVNTSNNGQGSLAQFILNSNALPNSTLDQVTNSIFNPPLGREVSIFMIPNQFAHPGLRAGLVDQLTNGVAVISPSTLLPIITDNSTSIDGRTQTANIGDLNGGSAGYVGKVGTGADGIAGTADDLTITAVSLPEVQITGVRSLIYGLGIDAQQTIVQGISIYGFGNDPYKQADIAFVGSQGQNSLITNNIIGAAANGFTDPGTATRGSAGIRSNSANMLNTQILHNLIGFHSYYGIGVTDTDGAKWDGGVISTNTIANNGLDASAAQVQAGIELDTPGYLGFVGTIISQNMLDANGNQGIQNNYGQNVTIINNTITNSGRLTNGTNSTEGMGILMLGSQSSTVAQNLINGGNYEGIAISNQANVKITKNSLYNNGTLGIDLIGTPGVSANNGTVNASIANQDLDYPIITSTNLSSGTLRAKGFVGNLTAGNPIFAGTTLEFFIADNNPANQDGEAILGDSKSVSHGEGRTYLGYCLADTNGKFDCAFPNAGTLGLTNAKNITATTTNSAGNTSEFSAVTVGSPNVLLVKRITAIDSNITTSNGQSFSNYYDDPSNPYDDNVLANPAPTPPDTDKWPNINSFLVGVTDGGKIKPKSILDYTIYFLSAGDVPANRVAICDLVPAHQTFKPNGFANVTHATNGSTGADRGIVAQINGETLSYTNLADGDIGRYYPPGEALPNACKLPDGTIPNNDQGAVVVSIGDIVNPANATTTNQSQGFVRFQTQVD